jgi:DNA-binding transcriptional LysR family regulator
MELFAAVVEAGSFARAARLLHLSPAAVTRAIAALEERLGVRLLNRTTRSLGLTEPGAGYLASIRRILADLDEAEQVAAGATGTPQGHLRLTAPATFGRMHLMPVLTDFLREQPKLTASLVTLDRVANLIEEGFDLALRIAQLPDSTIVARRIGSVRRLLVASPDYLGRRGMPLEPSDLAGHDLIAFEDLFDRTVWRFVRNGRTQSVDVRPRVAVNDALAAIAAAERGDGITGALSYVVAAQLAAGSLVTVLDDFSPPPVPVQLVYPQGRLVAPKVRAFVDFAAPRLARAIG